MYFHFFFELENLSGMRPAMNSHSNWAKAVRMPRCSTGIDLLCHESELNAPFVELFSQVGEITDQTGEPVKYIDYYTIGKSELAFNQQFLQCRPTADIKKVKKKRNMA